MSTIKTITLKLPKTRNITPVVVSINTAPSNKIIVTSKGFKI